MRLLEIAEPNSNSQKIAQFINEHCQPWLNAVGEDVFYRGTKTKGDNVGDYSKIVTVRSNRAPVDSSAQATEAFNDAISKAGGVANRSNSSFITSDYDGAKSYVRNSEHVYIVFPIGSFHYTWSPELLDWFNDAVQKGKILKYVDTKKAIDVLKAEHPDKEIAEVLNYDDFLFPLTSTYIHSTPIGSYHVSVVYRNKKGEEIEKRLRLPVSYDMIDIDKFAKVIVVDNGIQQAAEMSAEVMLTPESQKLLLVNPQFYQSEVRSLL